MLRTFTKLVLLAFVFTVYGCFTASERNMNKADRAQPMQNFSSMLDEYYEEGLKLNPLAATESGDYRYNHLFPNTLSASYLRNKKLYYQKFQTLLSLYDRSRLSDSEQTSRDILAWECEINLANLDFQHEQMFPIDQMWTVNLQIAKYASGDSSQPFKTVTDYENWLQRLDAYVDWLSFAMANMREGIRTGYVMPKALILKVLPQLEEMTQADLSKNLFYSPARNFPKDFSPKDRQTLTVAYAKMVNNKIIPAYSKLSNFMKSDYLKAGRDSSGVSDLPRGKEYYAHQIKKHATTNMSADEIHQLGLAEVARIGMEMQRVKESLGFSGDLKSFFASIRTNKQLMPYKTPEEVLAAINSIHDRMKPSLEKLFSQTPKTGFEIRRTESFREQSASAEYQPGSVDGVHPGVFYVPIPDAQHYNNVADEALFLHEAIPGHHYQISLAQENTALPKFRKTLWYSSFGEGWALYTESLGKELGLYTDPYQYFGMLGMEMHRAIRLVVDTGIHAMGWTRERAIAYSLEHEAESEEGIISEIERYMANPGQALSYKLGQIHIIALRKKAETTMGEKFDIRQFHQKVLEDGCLPLAVLDKKITAWADKHSAHRPD